MKGQTAKPFIKIYLAVLFWGTTVASFHTTLLLAPIFEKSGGLSSFPVYNAKLHAKPTTSHRTKVCNFIFLDLLRLYCFSSFLPLKGKICSSTKYFLHLGINTCNFKQSDQRVVWFYISNHIQVLQRLHWLFKICWLTLLLVELGSVYSNIVEYIAGGFIIDVKSTIPIHISNSSFVSCRGLFYSNKHVKVV